MANYTLSARITADAKQFIAGIKQAQNEMNGLQKFSNKVSQKFSDFGNKVGKVGSNLTNKITKPALAAGAAVGGIVIGKGFQRLAGIDTARAKLVGLGHDAKNIETIMDSALTSVKGTSYGLDEAATTAANAVAAGIKPGKELTRYLTLAGDAAAIAGADMSEMGSILNKVQTTNKAYNGDLQQLAERGLPVYQWLADAAGVNEEAIFDMASQGKISSEMLLDAIETNIGGAAKKMGEESFMAGLANIWAAVGRLGASFLDASGEGGGFFSVLKDNIPAVIDHLDGLGDKAEKAGEKFGQFFMNVIEKAKDLKQRWDDLSPAVQSTIAKFALFGSIGLIALGPILSTIAKFSIAISGIAKGVTTVISIFRGLGAVFTFLLSPAGLFIAAIALIATLAYLIYDNWAGIKEFFSNLWESIKDAGLQIWENLKEGWQNAKENLVEAWESVTEFFSELWESIKEVFTETWESITETWSLAVETLYEIFTPINEFFTELWEGVKETTFEAWASVLEFFHELWESLMEFFMISYEWLNEMTGGAFGEYVEIIQAAFDTIWEIVTSAWEFIKETFGNALDFLMALVTGDFEGMKEAINNQMESARNLLSNIWSAIQENIGAKLSEILSDVRARFEEIKASIQSKITEARERVVSIFSNIVSSIRGKASEVVSTVTSKFNEARDKIVQPIEKARDKIKQVVDRIKGFFSGMKLSIPKIKLPPMPKFQMTGKFSLTPPSVPKLSVKWHAQGGLMKRPTMFGMAGNTMLGGGEAGPEAILPLNSRVLGDIGKGVANTMSYNETESDHTHVAKAIDSLEQKLTNLTMVMDEREVARILERPITEMQDRNINIKTSF